jgi:Uma2 family endonuclease
MEQTAVAVMTLDQFMQRYSDQGPFELIDGAPIPVNPQITRSARIAGRLFVEMTLYVKAKDLGEVFSETPFALTADSSWVTGSRVPDLMFVQAERLTKLAADDPQWEDKPLLLVPDLVVEIVSPTDRASEISKKIARYVDDGVRVVWLIEPETQTVTVYTSGSKQITQWSSGDTLDGGDMIPGFAMPVAGLFG